MLKILRNLLNQRIRRSSWWRQIVCSTRSKTKPQHRHTFIKKHVHFQKHKRETFIFRTKQTQMTCLCGLLNSTLLLHGITVGWFLGCIHNCICIAPSNGFVVCSDAARTSEPSKLPNQPWPLHSGLQLTSMKVFTLLSLLACTILQQTRATLELGVRHRVTVVGWPTCWWFPPLWVCSIGFIAEPMIFGQQFLSTQYLWSSSPPWSCFQDRKSRQWFLKSQCVAARPMDPKKGRGGVATRRAKRAAARMEID